MVFQVRIHGRGGQGVVTAAELLSVAAFAEGRHAQAFPSFGSERTGAPVVAFCRISDTEIRVREPVMNPNAVIIQDTTLLHHVDVFSGLVDGGYVLVNSAHPFESLGIGDLTGGMTASRIVTVPATELALEHLGRPVPNIVLLGGLAALTGIVSLPSVLDAVRQKFHGSVAEGNIAAATAAFELVQSQVEERVDAQAG
jgi:pyruvate ferredoxin oxidoreductase gamma subunit